MVEESYEQDGRLVSSTAAATDESMFASAAAAATDESLFISSITTNTDERLFVSAHRSGTISTPRGGSLKGTHFGVTLRQSTYR